MLAPASRSTRSPGVDFTVLVSLTAGLLVWLVLACFGLARLQQQATLQLQRAAADLLTAQVAPPVARGASLAEVLADRPELRALADSAGLHVAVRTVEPRGAGTTTESLMRQALAGALASRPLTPTTMLVVERAVSRSSLAMAPIGPQLLLAFVVALLAITTSIGGALLVRLRREHLAARERSTFASAVSHELRTPLAQILLFAETLQLGRTRTERDRTLALGAIVQEARRLMRLVDNVLRFTRLEQGAATLRQEPVPVAQLVRDTASHFAPLAETSLATIEVETHGEAVALADADAVRQVVLNLLDNAVKHGTRAAGDADPPARHRIRARVEQRAAQIRVIVEDDGPGLAGDDRQRIWLPFERGARAGSATGAGLGLMIVRSLTEAMGGEVLCEASAADGRGARFIVELPALHPVAPTAAAA